MGVGEPNGAGGSQQAGHEEVESQAEDVLSGVDAQRARALAERIAAAAPLSVQAAKLSAMAAMDIVSGHALKEASYIHEKAYTSEDAIEGPRAFAEKRKPVWKGR